MACTITRGPKGEIDKVLAQNGEPSKLYDTIRFHLADLSGERSLNVYAKLMKNLVNHIKSGVKTDENGEPTVVLTSWGTGMPMLNGGIKPVIAKRTINTLGSLSQEGDNWREKYFGDKTELPVSEILSKIASTGKPYNKNLAARLLQTGKVSPDSRIYLLEDEDFENRFGKIGKLDGLYDKESDSIFLRNGTIANGDLLILHEVIHNLTKKILSSDSKESNAFKNLFVIARKRMIDEGYVHEKEYVISDVDEFLAGLFTSPKLSSILKQMKPIRNRPVIKNMWDEVLDVLKRFFGWSQSDISLLEDAMDLGIQVIQSGADNNSATTGLLKEDHPTIIKSLNNVSEGNAQLGETIKEKLANTFPLIEVNYTNEPIPSELKTHLTPSQFKELNEFTLYEDEKTLCPGGICNYTAKKSTDKLKSVGLNPYPVGSSGSGLAVRVKSPIGDFDIEHYVSAVAINDSVYIYDMPQDEFVSDRFYGSGSDVDLKQAFSPRLIPLTVDSIASNYKLTYEEAARFIRDLLDNRGYSNETINFKDYIIENISQGEQYIALLENEIEQENISPQEDYRQAIERRVQEQEDKLNEPLTPEESDKIERFYINKLKLRLREYIPRSTDSFSLDKYINEVLGKTSFYPNHNLSLDQVLYELKSYINSDSFVDEMYTNYKRSLDDYNEIENAIDSLFTTRRLIDSFFGNALSVGFDQALSLYNKDQRYKIQELLHPSLKEKSDNKTDLVISRKYLTDMNKLMKAMNIFVPGVTNFNQLITRGYQAQSKLDKANTILSYLKAANFDASSIYDSISHEARRRYAYFAKQGQPQFQKNEYGEVVGQANLDALSILIDRSKEKADTLPHEYAHHYISWFENTPLVKEGIKRFGSVEELVSRIGEQVIKQDGEAYGWWKEFVDWLLGIMSDEQIVGLITDSLLMNGDLTAVYSKAIGSNPIIGDPNDNQDYNEYVESSPGEIAGQEEDVFFPEEEDYQMEYNVDYLEYSEPYQEFNEEYDEAIEEDEAFLYNFPQGTYERSGAVETIKEDEYYSIPVTEISVGTNASNQKVFSKRYHNVFYKRTENPVTKENLFTKADVATVTKYEDEYDDKQKELLEKLNKTKDIASGEARYVTAEEFNQKQKRGAVKGLLRVKDGLWRNVILDEETGEEIFIANRPSDLGQFEYAKKRNFDKVRMAEENNSRDSIILRGMGTTLHMVMENLVKELDRQNTLDPVTGKFMLINPDIDIPSKKDFFQQNKAQFLKSIGKESSEELQKIYKSLKSNNRYTHKLDENRLIDPGSNVVLKPEDTEYTFDNKDFESLLELAFNMYYQIYKKQGELSWNVETKRRPAILVEAPILDLKTETMGSIDMMAVFADGKVGHYDYKFVSMKPGVDMVFTTGISDEKIRNQKAETIRNRKGESMPNVKKGGLEYVDDRVINKFRAKQRPFDMQVSEYKNILVNGYDVPRGDIVESRVVPIAIVLQSRKMKQGGYESLSKLEFIDHKDKLLRQIPLAKEMIGDEGLDRFISKLFNKLDKSLRQLERDKHNDRLKQDIDRLKQNIEALQLEKDIGLIARNSIELIETMRLYINQPEYIPVYDENDNLTMADNPKYLNFSEIMELQNLMISYEGLRDASRNEMARLEETMDPDKFEELRTSLNDQNQLTQLMIADISDVVDNRIKEASEQGGFIADDRRFIDVTVTEEEIKSTGLKSPDKLSEYGDIGTLDEWMSALSDLNHPHVRLLKNLLDDVNKSTMDYAMTVQQRMDKVTRDLEEFARSRGVTGIDVYKYIVDPNTKNLMPKYEENMHAKVKEARRNRDVKWLKDNIVLDKERYKKFYDIKLTQARNIYKDNQAAINKFMEKIERDFDLESNEVALLYPNNSFWKLKDEEKFFSKEWKFMLQNPVVKAYYETAQEIIGEMQNNVSDSMYINDRFIPNVMRDTVDILAENGVFDSKNLKGIKDLYAKILAVREEDSEMGTVIDGELVDKVPLSLFDRIPGGVKNKSADVSKSILLGAYSAKLYAATRSIEGVALALRHSLANTRLLQSGALGTNNPNQHLEIGEESKLLKAMDRWIANYIYGRKTQSKKDSDSNRKFVKTINNIKGFHSSVNLAFNTASAIAGHIGATSQLLQVAARGRYFTKAQFVKGHRSYTKMDKKAGLMCEYFNLSTEGNGNIIHEKANKISTSSLRRKFSKNPMFILQRWSDDAIDNTILLSMLENYAFHPNGRDVFKLEEKWRLKGTKWEGQEIKPIIDSIIIKDNPKDDELPFEIKSFDGSRAMTSAQYINFRNKVKYVAGVAKGNYNVDDIAGYKTNVFMNALMHYRGWLPSMLMERYKNPKYNHTMEELEIGRYRVAVGEIIGKGVIPAMKKFGSLLVSLGADAVTFNKFGITKTDKSRAKIHFDKWRLQNPGDYKTGLAKYSHLNTSENPQAAADALFDEWITIREKQLQSLAAELRAYLIVTLGLVSVGMAAGDDDKEQDPMIRVAMRYLDRTAMEIGFFIIPSEQAKIVTRSPLPMLGLINDSLNLLGNTIGETIDFVTGTDPNKKVSILSPGRDPFNPRWFEERPDNTPKFHYITKFVPYANGLNKVLEFTEMNKEKQTLMEYIFGNSDTEFYKK